MYKYVYSISWVVELCLFLRIWVSSSLSSSSSMLDDWGYYKFLSPPRWS